MKNVNSVCYINTINSISPIEGADKIEQCTVNGWSSIVQKGKHKVGDLVLCITNDAVIPEELAVGWGVDTYLRKGSRVRTIRLKGVISECILIDVHKIGSTGFKKYNEGEDMMDHFKIFKYEPPAIIVQDSQGRKHKYNQNPNFHIYQKFPNQKNTPGMFNEEDLVSISRKIHGTSCRFAIMKKTKLSILDKIKILFGNEKVKYEFIVGSHNVIKNVEYL